MNEIQYYLTEQQLGWLFDLGQGLEDPEAAQDFATLLVAIQGQRIEFEKVTGIAMIGQLGPGESPLNLQQQAARPGQVRCYDGADHIWDFRQRSLDGAAERYCTKCGAVSA
jgi:hypothetical protein